MSEFVNISVASGDPQIQIDIDALTRGIAQLCKNNNITTDAQWTTLCNTVFNSTNASGLSPATRTFMAAFFSKLIKVSPPVNP